MNDSKKLNFDALKKNIAPTKKISSESNREISTQSWPSRDPGPKGVEMQQMTVRISKEQAERFQALCKNERYSYGAMLKILMDDAGR